MRLGVSCNHPILFRNGSLATTEGEDWLKKGKEGNISAGMIMENHIQKYDHYNMMIYMNDDLLINYDLKLLQQLMHAIPADEWSFLPLSSLLSDES